MVRGIHFSFLNCSFILLLLSFRTSAIAENVISASQFLQMKSNTKQVLNCVVDILINWSELALIPIEMFCSRLMITKWKELANFSITRRRLNATGIILGVSARRHFLSQMDASIEKQSRWNVTILYQSNWLGGVFIQEETGFLWIMELLEIITK